MSSPLPKKTHGSCLCKKVNYELKGDPGTFVVCYCVNCQKATGSAFMANTFWRVEVSRLACTVHLKREPFLKQKLIGTENYEWRGKVDQVPRQRDNKRQDVNPYILLRLWGVSFHVP